MQALSAFLVVTALLSLSCGGIGLDPVTRGLRDRLQAFYISSPSMAPTLLPGDRIWVDKAAYRDSLPSRGDVIVFWVSFVDKDVRPRDRYPDAEVRAFIFRIIGLPGDTIRMEDGMVYVNGGPEIGSTPASSVDLLDETFDLYRLQTSDQSYRIIHSRKTRRYSFSQFIVDKDRYFVLGDNRDGAYDGRYWGTVHRSDILGKAWRIYFSTNPGSLWLRPSRFFLRIHETNV